MQGSELRKAPRFSAAIPVMTECGKASTTRDVSSSGIFFETDGSFTPGQSIEFSIFLEHLYPDRPALLKCKGSIVRVEKSGEKIGVATTIDFYSIEDHIPRKEI
ncbi:MAG: PilZ domain-containing protein [Syntrophales bacterium LBB04]|nr:PilZ domain-containing protein [Syntrophales bacterium LBB04]